MRKILQFISKHFAWFFIIGLILGLIFQGVAAFINPSIYYILMFVLFLSYLKVDSSVMKKELKNLKITSLLLLFKLIILPICFYTLSIIIIKVFKLNHDWSIATLLLYSAPAGVICPTAALLLGGHFERCLSNVVLGSFLAPITIPLLLYLFAKGESIELGQVGLNLAILVISPFIIAQLVKRFAAQKVEKMTPYISPISVILLCTVIIGALKGVRTELESHPEYLFIILAMLTLFFIIAFSLPWLLMAKKSKEDRMTLSVLSTWMNNGVIIVLASSFLNNPLITLFVIISELPWGFAFLPASIWAKKQRIGEVSSEHRLGNKKAPH